MMQALLLLLSVTLSAAVAFPSGSQQRIVGGSLTTIEQYPQAAVILFVNNNSWFFQICGGTILSKVAVLTAAHCFTSNNNPTLHRVRVGSSFSNSGGEVHNVRQIISHSNYNYNMPLYDNDIAMVRLASSITYTQSAQPGFIAGTSYLVPDNQPLWTIGWGSTEQGVGSEQLRHVQVYSINQNVCRERYASWPITDNMICAGVLDVGGRDACTGDSGGPLLYNNVVVGITSFGFGCGHPNYPGVYTRVSQYTRWIIRHVSEEF